MKKYFLTIVISLIIGFILSYYMIKEYDDAVMPTLLATETIYLVEQGVYSSYDNMLENTKTLNSYIYNFEDELYYVYIGMSLIKDNAIKIQNAYEFNTIIKKINRNDEFNNTIREYDVIISKTSDNEIIKEVSKQLLSKYKGGNDG